MRIMTFDLNGVNVGILLSDIIFIGSRVNVAQAPSKSGHIMGFAMLRGEAVPVYSLALRFGYTEQKTEYLVVVNAGGIKLGLETGRIGRIIDVEQDAVAPIPVVIDAKRQCFRKVVSCQNQVILLLDVGRLMLQEEKRELCQLVENAEGGGQK